MYLTLITRTLSKSNSFHWIKVLALYLSSVLQTNFMMYTVAC